MGNGQFIDECKKHVAAYVNLNGGVNGEVFCSDDVYVVWISKVLQNNKALLSTPISDGMYYEITYNGDKNEFYLDAYKKVKNIKINL